MNCIVPNAKNIFVQNAYANLLTPKMMTTQLDLYNTFILKKGKPMPECQ